MQLGPTSWATTLRNLGKMRMKAMFFFTLNMGIEPMLFPKVLDYTFCGEKFVRGKCLFLCKLSPLPWPSCPKKKKKLWQVLRGKEKEFESWCFFPWELANGPKVPWGTMFSQGTCGPFPLGNTSFHRNSSLFCS